MSTNSDTNQHFSFFLCFLIYQDCDAKITVTDFSIKCFSTKIKNPIETFNEAVKFVVKEEHDLACQCKENIKVTLGFSEQRRL